jgi:hypothetical protein
MLHQRPRIVGGGLLGGGLLVALALAGMVAIWPASGATAQDGARRTLTIYKAECPPGYVGEASADECDTSPVTGVPFRVGRPFTEAFTDYVPTDDEGLVAFEFDGLPLDGTLRVIEQIPANTERFVVYCVDGAGDPLSIAYPDDVGNPDLGVADVAVGEAGDVACDWYNVPRAGQASGAMTASAVDQETRAVRMTEEPSWWVVPFAPGWGNTEEGHLYFGALVENATAAIVHVGVSFRAYEADGTPFPGCNAPLGEGPGVTTTIAPGETALVTCARTIVPRTLDGLQVTARLWDTKPLRSPPAAFEVMEADFAPVPEQSSPMETIYEASALVRAASNDDTDVALLFRFYDKQGIQTGTCESDSTTVEPEVEQRITCSSPLLQDTTSPQPIRVQAEALPGRE